MKVSVVTWNVLADCYAHGGARSTVATEAERGALSAERSPHSWSYRCSLLRHCIANCVADVVCMQEVDHYDDFYRKCFDDNGFKSIYYQRPDRKDGCLIAFRTAKLSLLAVDRVSCNDGIDADSLYEHQKYEKHNVGLTLKLEVNETKQQFLVATCHIHWNPSLPDVKLSQVLYILERLWAFRDGEDLPVVLTGDFNTLPDDPLYRGITQPNSIAALTAAYREVKYGGDLYGPKTRFLCDASLTKLCKWLRVLGVNVALDAWDNGVPASSSKHKNKAKWQWTCAPDNNTAPVADTAIPAGATPSVAPDGEKTPQVHDETANDAQKAPDLSYAARVSSINAFFARAEREKRVILTTSKSLRERASCPRNFYVNPTDLKQGLIDIATHFGLELSRDRFLTVCGKCGDDVEEVTPQDPRLQGKYLPSDRPVYACVNCAQVHIAGTPLTPFIIGCVASKRVASCVSCEGVQPYVVRCAQHMLLLACSRIGGTRKPAVCQRRRWRRPSSCIRWCRRASAGCCSRARWSLPPAPAALAKVTQRRRSRKCGRAPASSRTSGAPRRTRF